MHIIVKEIFQFHYTSFENEIEKGILIRKCLLIAAITKPEMFHNQINYAFEHFKHEQYSKKKKTLEAITEIGLKERAKCPIHGEYLKKLKSILDSPNSNDSTPSSSSANQT